MDQEYPLSNANRVPIRPLACSNSRSRSVAYTALCIALIAVSANITIPLGPIPFTLQMFAIPFMIQILTPKQAIAALVGYLILGMIGLPVFSGMRGGFGVMLGPTGGFLWAYLIGVPLAAGVLALFRKRGIDNLATGILSGCIFTVVAYCGGWLWYMIMAHVTPVQSFLVTVAPFVLLDLVKVVLAAFAARGVIRALYK